jgi:hypothetical protein
MVQKSYHANSQGGKKIIEKIDGKNCQNLNTLKECKTRLIK